ncbi:MAG: FAD binding domain-containing protein [Rhodospirillaceae bacterium]|nr:FAD binding domain-containing protein [Rhodospirillaceae bacterium]
MDALHSFEVIRPKTVDEALAARIAHRHSRMIGGGTDLLVNIRRRIETPSVLIDTSDLTDLKTIEHGDTGLSIGASVRLFEVAEHPNIQHFYPAIAQAAGSIAGPTHRNMGTVGGNLCLDTRCIYYNQSEWWREANDHCLKTELGDMCHVAPKSKGVCFATYSGDLAPALMLFGAEIDLLGPDGERTVAMRDFYIGSSRQDGSKGDGINYMAIKPGEFVVRVRASSPGRLISGYDKIRIRRSIEYPVAGCAAALTRDDDTLTDIRIAFTGTNPRPVFLEGTADLAGSTLSDSVLEGIDNLCKDQLMSMKTTFTPGHYRRRVATQMAKRLVGQLFNAAG